MEQAVKRIAVLPLTEILCQLAEESAELAQAALKLRRCLDGKNPTPTDAEAAKAALEEELADVFLCYHVMEVSSAVDPCKVAMIEGTKLERWAGRLEKAKQP